jgi:membrane protein
MKTTVYQRIYDKTTRWLREHPHWRRALAWSKKTSLPGMGGIPIYNLVLFIFAETNEDVLITRASSMAFSFFMAIFPSIIVLFTLLAYTPLYQNFDDVLRESIDDFMPGTAGALLFKTIQDIATIPRGGLLSFGFFLGIWFASNGMLSMMRGLEKNYRPLFRRRSYFEKRLIAIQLTFLVASNLVAAVLFVIFGGELLGLLFNYIKADWFTRLSLLVFRWVVVLALFYSTFSTIYRYGSSARRRISFFNPGAMLATLLSLLTSSGFSFYVDNFGSYNKVYGSIGTLIVLMIWLQLNCMILLIGFELNAGIAVIRARRKPAPAEEAAVAQAVPKNN